MKKTLIIGASLKPERYSNMAIRKLRNNNIDVEAIGIKTGKVDDVEIHALKKEIENIDTVSLYVNPSLQKEYYQYILKLNPKRVIFNPGTENEELYTLLEKNNISFEASCTLVLLSTNQY